MASTSCSAPLRSCNGSAPHISSDAGFLPRCSCQPALDVRAVVLLDVVHAVDGDCEAGGVVARDELLLREIPDREFEMFAGAAGHLRELVVRRGGVARP